jgi:hypothetical protein
MEPMVTLHIGKLPEGVHLELRLAAYLKTRSALS